ncbi:Multifunctional non-homologous end joining protein LigD [Sulfitobacter sp. DSM 110093]|uniref:DNA ligase D n=1 Tax=Sulfitobacter sp. DSM 110093 TaxID=2883127 RepID=UPI001FACC2B8|nr:DNA ligase D [Sulfitobacter sp. DSM 110093]UOA32219.1 Multifunctional non-homologous end joining protein LigD [Sulfitobacter sp. DSM 110093]
MGKSPDKLASYNDKRDFKATSEPRGQIGKGAGQSFVVQKHDATRLHYDFRLEWEGVLLSWAVTKGPSSAPSEKRLAVRTEDHPLEYGGFEGTIPKGQYGGGTVMLWDRGTWMPQSDVAKGLKDGKLKFTLQGQQMQGGWTLVRMHSGEKRENWLLIKERDDYADDVPDGLTKGTARSITSGRTMTEIAKDAPAKEVSDPRPKRKGKNPAFVKPQLATLVSDAPEGGDWIHETKFDGYRCLVSIGKSGARLYTRSGNDWTDKFSGLAGAFDTLPCDRALLDGEVMAAKIKGSAFSSLQRALKEGHPLVFYAFDLLSLDGEDFRATAQDDRRARLAKLLSGVAAGGSLRLSDHVVGHGPEVFDRACKAGAEGIISKRIEASYSGKRSRNWLKIKCTRRQEFIIIGYSPSDKKGRAFASLLLGSHEGGELRYKGRIGTGFSTDVMDDIFRAMTACKTPPAKDTPPEVARGAKWVCADLVAEVDFTEFTADGVIRHGSFLGLRRDKKASEVTLEEPEEEPEMSTGSDSKIGGVPISNGDRKVFPDAGCTKGDVARHYDRVGAQMIELMGQRPLSLFRCPSGIDGQCFFQKHDSGGMPDALSRVCIEQSDGDAADYLYATRTESLIAAAQMGSLEYHIWGARVDRLDRPDRLVFDLDPDEGLDWDDVRAAAFEVRDALSILGLNSGAIVTGGKGVHVWLALRRTRGWDTVKLFSKTFAHVMSTQQPERYTASMSKAKRKGRIFIDWLRNERGSTAIAPYSLRARPGAPVAVPVTWKELEKLDSANGFHMGDMAARLDHPCPALAVQGDLQSLTDGVIEKLQAWSEG